MKMYTAPQMQEKFGCGEAFEYFQEPSWQNWGKSR